MQVTERLRSLVGPRPRRRVNLQQDDKYPKTLADAYYRIDQYKYNTKIIQRAAGKTATPSNDEFDTGHSFLSACNAPTSTMPTAWEQNVNGKNVSNGIGTRETGSTNPSTGTNPNIRTETWATGSTKTTSTDCDATKEIEAKIICYNCDRDGHASPDCTFTIKTGGLAVLQVHCLR